MLSYLIMLMSIDYINLTFVAFCFTSENCQVYMLPQSYKLSLRSP